MSSFCTKLINQRNEMQKKNCIVSVDNKKSSEGIKLLQILLNLATGKVFANFQVILTNSQVVLTNYQVILAILSIKCC